MCLGVIFFILMLLQFAKLLDLVGWCLMSFGKLSVASSVSILPVPPPSHFSIFLILVGLYWKMLDPFHCVPHIAHDFLYFPSIFLPWASLWISFDLFSITNPVLCFANLLLNYNIEFLISGIFFSSKIIWLFFFFFTDCSFMLKSLYLFHSSFKKNILYNN